MFWKNATRSVAIATTLAIAALSLPTDAFAGDRYGHKRYYRDPRPPVVYYKHRRHHNDAGVAVAAGILGLTVGALIASAPPRRTYYAPQPVYRAPRNVYYDSPEPYSGEWYRYCAAKYRSFDAASGTFMSYSGVRKLCR
ncbi:MAG: BA14K family protein [Rhodobiaceae bacterium]|nr:BA14K family protein [Rhodobiaceae bacterium]